MPRVVPSQVVAVIDQLFPGAIDQLNNPGKELKLDIGASDKLTAIVDLIDKIPHELLILQADQYTNLVASIGAIRNSLAMWKARGAIGILGHMSGLRKLNPVTLIRQALVECPDEYPPEETAESSFITNDELRKNLRNDLAVTQKALSNGEWKPATVLAGSIVEALLLWKLEQRSPSDISNAIRTLLTNETLKIKPGTPLDTWDLHSYVEVAVKLGEIKPDTASQIRLAKDFRNLIHPGRAQRLGLVCDRGTAYSAVAAVSLVIRDITS